MENGGGDFYFVHNYFRHLKAEPKDRIIGLTEFGGIPLNVPGRSTIGDQKVYGYKHFKTEKDLEKSCGKMIRTEIRLIMKEFEKQTEGSYDID